MPVTVPAIGSTGWGVSLNAALQQLNDQAARPQGAWQPTTAYAVNDIVQSGGSTYRCIVAHTSGASFGGVAGGNWEQWGSGGSGAATLRDRGNWVTATAYAVGDVVTFTADRYACSTAHTSGTFATDSANWILLGSQFGLPAGGTTGQIPAKASNADGDVSYITPSQPSQITPQPVGTVGQIGTSQAYSREDHVHVGGTGSGSLPSNQMWLPAAGAWTSGTQVQLLGTQSNSAGAATSYLNFIPVQFSTNCPIQFGVWVKAAGDSGTTFGRVFVYTDGGSIHGLGTLAHDSGRISASATGRVFSSTTFTPDPTKRYWIAGAYQTSATPTTNAAFYQGYLPAFSLIPMMGTQNPAQNPNAVRFVVWPDTPPSSPAWSDYLTTDFDTSRIFCILARVA